MPIDADPEYLSGAAARAQSCADCFQLPLKDRAWKGSAGDFTGSGLGSSLDFQDHRNYMPGDDPRHINWQAYARTGNYTMKLYREEVRPVVEIVLDVSDSHFFDPGKAARTFELFYFCHFSSLSAGTFPIYYLVKGDRQTQIKLDEVASHQWVREVKSMPDTASSAPPRLQPIPFRSQSLRIFIGDLLFAGNPEAFFRELTRGKGGAIVLCPFAACEASPLWDGNYEFVDSESGTRHDRRVDRHLLSRYLGAYQRHFDGWKLEARKHRIALAKVPSELDLAAALQQEAISVGAVQLAA